MADPDKSASRRIPAIPASVLGALAAAQKAPQPRILRGMVREGVERGSVVLLDERGLLLAQLMGGDRALLADGARVEVTGAFRNELSTTAQQGTPFQVDSVTAIDPPHG